MSSQSRILVFSSLMGVFLWDRERSDILIYGGGQEISTRLLAVQAMTE